MKCTARVIFVTGPLSVLFLVLASREVISSAAGLARRRKAQQTNSSCCPALVEELVEAWLLCGCFRSQVAKKGMLGTGF
jgi:hypothetical protein